MGMRENDGGEQRERRKRVEEIDEHGYGRKTDREGE